MDGKECSDGLSSSIIMLYMHTKKIIVQDFLQVDLFAKLDIY